MIYRNRNVTFYYGAIRAAGRYPYVAVAIVASDLARPTEVFRELRARIGAANLAAALASNEPQATRQ
jgi:hypothetical protein